MKNKEELKKVNEKANEVRELTDEELAQVVGGVTDEELAQVTVGEKKKFERTKPHVTIGTMGHVDYGKVALTVDINKEAAR